MKKKGQILKEFMTGNLKLLKIARNLIRLKAVEVRLETWGITREIFIRNS